MQYQYTCQTCGKTWEENHSIENRNKPLEYDVSPVCEQNGGCVISREYDVSVTYNHGGLLNKVPNSFHDQLKEWKKSYPENKIQIR